MPSDFVRSERAAMSRDAIRSNLVSVTWSVVTNTRTEVPFDVCVSNVVVLLN